MRTAAGVRGGGFRRRLLLLLLLLLSAALSFPAEQPGFQPLSHLSSYEITVPKRIEREQLEASQKTWALVFKHGGTSFQLTEAIWNRLFGSPCKITNTILFVGWRFQRWS
ncbi:disintegrin and metalloproteinase domain-containing protein 9-like [Candoia aspera]|uniref:disintegrin and metalloproteinase domain-containing protein 9-like n=1 Tax=Candoia aspera TaxID=51853 RepID=UPI002FD7D0C5